MKKSKIVLMAWALVPILAFAESDYEAVVDDSVVGYWRFNDPNDYGKDSSGHGSHITEFRTTTTAGGVADSARDGGYLQLKKDGSSYGTAIATANGPRTVDLSSSTKGWTIATWIRGTESIFDLEWYQKMLITGDAEDFYDAMTDGKWHPIVVVFRSDKEQECYRIYVNPFDSGTVTDVCSTQDKPGKYNWKFPVSISGTSITLGGELAGSGTGFGSMSADFFGDLDDCLIIDRELESGGEPTTEEKKAEVVRTDDEVFRLVQTGETFVFSKGSSGNMFYEAGDWSNKKSPQPGLAYIVENGHEVKFAKNWLFVGKSLSVGRTEKLYGIKSVGGAKEVIVDNTVGRLTQLTANTVMQFQGKDLILNDGTLTSTESGQQLWADARVRAKASNPFKIAVSNGTYKVSGSLRGTGSVVKVGPATLDLSALSNSTAKVSLSEGSLRLPAVNPTLSGYSGGTLLVDFNEGARTATTVTIESAWTGALAFKLNGTPTKTERYAVIKVPTSVKTVTAADFDNQTVGGMSMRTSVVTDGSVQTVYLECVSAADQEGSPVVSFE